MSQAVPGRRTTGANGENDLAFSMALWKKGFVAFPSLLLHYGAEALLDYESTGMLLHLLFLLDDRDDSLSGEYRIRAQDTDHERFSAVRNLAVMLDQRELILIEVLSETEIRLSLRPLYARLRAAWLADLQHKAPDQTPALSPADKMAQNQGLLRLAEQRFGRPLAAREIDTLIHWVEELGLSHEAVEVMIEEAHERGRLRFDYLNGIARDWAQKGVRTRDDAEAARTRHRELLARHDRIVRYLGLGRRLTAAEEGLLEKWTTEWGFSEDLVLKACDQTVNIKDPNFRYIDAVLEGWKSLGVRTVADAEVALSEHKSRRPPAGAPSMRKAQAATGRSNVFLPVEKKDRAHYEEFFDKPRKR